MEYIRTIHNRGSVLFLESPEELHEFKQLVARAVNTWEQAPQWAKDLNDTLQNNPIIT